jgi:hypothetical protein
MTEYHALDLFCGLGGFSAAFDDSDRWQVTTVDIETRFDPDIQADVFDLRPSDFEREFDIVLASPPCTQFSNLQHIHHDGEYSPTGDAVALPLHTVGLIQGICPSYWILENPKGMLRQYIGNPVATVDYCEYGHYTKKPTDLWGQHPPMTYRRCGHKNHRKGGITDFERGPSDPAERAKVPYALSESIRDACERALDGEVAEQVELGEVVG